MRTAIVGFLGCQARSWLRISAWFAGTFLLVMMWAAVVSVDAHTVFSLSARVAFFVCVAVLLMRFVRLLIAAAASRDWLAIALGGCLGCSVVGGAAFCLLH
jgi:uncharacterized membrane protein (Fun14 family)